MSLFGRILTLWVFSLASVCAFAANTTVVERATVHSEAAGGIQIVQLPVGFPADLTAPDDYSTGTLFHRIVVNNAPAGANTAQYRICFVQDALNRACSDGQLQFDAAGTFEANQTVASLTLTGVVDWAAPLMQVEVTLTDTAGVAVDPSETTWIGAPDYLLYYPLDISYESVIVSNGDVFAGYPSDNRVAAPVLSPPTGTYELQASVGMTSDTPNAMIYYTTDGTDPTEASTLYDGTAVNVTADTTIRARAFEAALTPSNITEETYTIVAQLTEGLRGRYFNGENFNEFVVTRTDARIEFLYDGSTEPAPGVDGSVFSVIWTGQVTPLYSETYTFSTNNDDGTRLWINNQLIIDDWNYHGVERREGTVTLQAGEQYSVWLEYFNGGGEGASVFQWASPTQPEEVIPNNALDPNSSNDEARISILGDDAQEIFEISTEQPTFIELRRRVNLDADVTVNLTYGGDAENGVDYQQLPATVRFAPGELVTYLELLPIDDTEVEGDELVTITLEEGDYTVSDPNVFTATLLDDDVNVTSISGDVIYTGTESGQIVVSAFRDDDAPHQAVKQTLVNPGPYMLVVEEGSYTVIAFVDSNDNEILDSGETWGQYEDETFELLKVDVPPSAENISINLDVAPGGPAPGDEEGGCCATTKPRNGQQVLLFVMLLGFVLARRRRILL